MDYFDLLHQAQMNDKSSSSNGSDIRCYKSTFSAPKKVDKSRVSSDNIKKFLARKEEEEKRKLLEAKKKKEELLALRSLDKKAQKRVQVMLKRTKSANKSVMADAIDNYNTKDTLEGPKQCDEDDYGYVSQEASAFYEKLMAKYEKAPVENLKQMNREVKDLQAAKDRVKAALDKEAEEMLHPTRKRKRKHEDGDGPDDDKEEDELEKKEKSKDKYVRETEKEPEKEKPKKISKKMPPPVDFFELMKIAAKKQHEPIMIEKKKVEEPERPMTKKEKLQRQKELEREMERKNRKNNPKGQSEGKPSGDKQSSSKDDTSKSLLKNRLTSDVPESSKQKSLVKSKSDASSNNTLPSFKKKEVKFSPSVETSPQPSKNNPISTVREKSSGSSDLKSKPLTNGHSKNLSTQGKVTSKVDNEEESPPKVDVSDIDKEIALLMKKKQMLMAKTEAAKSQKPPPKSNPVPQSSRDSMQRPAQSGVNKPTSLPVKKPSADGHNGMPPKVNDRDRLQAKTSVDRDRLLAKGSNDRDRLQGKISDREKLPVKNAMDKDRLQSKMANGQNRLPVKGSDSRPGANAPQRKFSPPRYGPPTRQPPVMMKKKKPPNKRVIDSESEYDSEMDDFIDDGPEDCMDYSSHIKEIFGYDKSRYSHIDEDECEESSFRTQMIEERRSAKIGLMEDLEDIQREKEEKARAKARLLKKKMSMKR